MLHKNNLVVIASVLLLAVAAVTAHGAVSVYAENGISQDNLKKIVDAKDTVIFGWGNKIDQRILTLK